MKPHVIISGGSGLIGLHLTQMLQTMEYPVTLLTRQYRSLTGIDIIRWDPEKNWCEDFNIKGDIAFINLAGENLSAKNWTPEQKEKILNSRTSSLKLLKTIVESKKDQVVRFVSTSAIGYYGTYTSENIFTEESEPGDDFLAKVCVEWEKAIIEIAQTGVSTAWLRTGVVLSDKGGALKAIIDSMRTGLSVPLGSGKQWVPWIHIRDLIRIFEFLLSKPEIQGVYNAVSPSYATNRDLTKAISKVKNKRFLPIGVPALFLKLILGEMASISLYGSRVSAQRIQDKGFKFNFPELEEAIRSFEHQSRVKK